MTDQLTGKVLADKYRIDSLISENPFGGFYHGTHVSMGKPVSIKVLSPKLAADEAVVKSFADEARTISRISHPNILNVTDYGSDKDGTIFIVYDDASGKSLKNLIEKTGKLPVERANFVVQEAASALSAAHDNGIIHQNLSAENVLVKQTATGTDEVKVLNFSSIQSYDAGNFDELNSVQAVEYFAPEQSDSAKIDKRSNVYSLGVILYEMLAGEVPFTADNPTDVLLKHREEMPSPLSAFRKDLPAEVEQVLLTALAKNPDSRYQSTDDFADALNTAATSGANGQAFAASAAVAAKEQPQNNIWKTAFIVLAGVSLLSVFFIYSTQTKQTDPQTQLITDANGIPVQPINPATGMTEQSLSNMNTFSPEAFSNANSAAIMQQMPPGTTTVTPGGDGYDPWANGGRPPAGAPPTYVGPGGQQVYVDGNGSVFMPSDGNSYIMVPKNVNTAANANTRVRNSNTNTNTAIAPANTAVKPTPAAPAANTPTAPIVKPTPIPKKTATPAPGGNPPSGKTQDLD